MDNSSYLNLQQHQYQHPQTQELTYAGHDTNLACTIPGSTSTCAANVLHNHGQVFSPSPPGNSIYGYGPSNQQSGSYGYPQEGSDSYSQVAGMYPSSAASYQPAHSFLNRSLYPELGPYPTANAYYESGVYQASSYPTVGYGGPPGAWSSQSHNGYGSYPGYGGYITQISNTTLGSVSSQTQYQQEYNQWSDYYANIEAKVQTANMPVPSSAPGTEYETPTNGALCMPTHASLLAQGNSSNSYLSLNQPPPPGTQPSWQMTPPSSRFETSFQLSSAGGTSSSEMQWDTTILQANDSCGQSGNHFQQVQTKNGLQLEQEESLPSSQQGSCVTHVPELSHLDNKKPLKFHTSAQQFTSLEVSKHHMPKLQIPTNPRITQNVGIVISGGPKGNLQDTKPEKSNKPQKPAYIGVRAKPSVNKVSADDITDATLQPGMFPLSLRAYVERALTLCKDDVQKTTCQDFLKEVITQATCDGSLFSKDWDTEPLHDLLSMFAKSVSTQTVASAVKLDSSSTRRSKSRWEPVGEIIEESELSINDDSSRAEVSESLKGHEFVASPNKWKRQDVTLVSHQQLQSVSVKSTKRGGKRYRKTDSTIGGVGASSESETDIDQGVFHLGTSLAIETPEEKQKRQTRTKRFEHSKDQTGLKALTRKNLPGCISARRTSAIQLAISFGDANGEAVEDINWDSFTIKGTCQEIEKQYLRLTSAPDPNTVRPEDVLRKALEMVQCTRKGYLYKCEQLKSIRQDLTVQRIRNMLTVQVYETHARMALEAVDLAEYNQCQTQLKGLYSEGIPGSYNEFTAYGLLYMVFQKFNNRDLLSSMARLSEETRQDEVVKHALAVRSAVATSNYVSFFRLYRMAPMMSSYLMDLHVERIRFEAIKCMSRSYRPTLPLPFIARTLGFTSLPLPRGDENESDGLEECEEWLKLHGATLIYESRNELMLDTKMSAATLFMPEPEDMVPHGDANLAVNDFLTRS